MRGAQANRVQTPMPAPSARRQAGSGRLDDFMATIMGVAAANPAQAPRIYQIAAERISRLAQQQRDAREGRRLNEMAQQLAAAAAGQQATIDDFEQLLEETAIAYDQMGDDPMGVIARRRQLRAETDGEDLRVSIAPESFHQDATLGRVVKIKYDPTADDKKNGILQSDTAVFWQGHKKEASAATIDLSVISQPITATTSEFAVTARPYAIVKYGSDGAYSTVKFDMGRGVRFTVVGNYVSVLVGMDPVEGISAEMTVSASLGMFAAPSQTPVFLTSYIEDLANNDVTDFIEIPSHAVQLYPPQTDATGGNLVLRFYGFAGGPIISTLSYPAGTISASPIPIPGDAGYLKVANLTGTDPARVRLPFQLSL